MLRSTLQPIQRLRHAIGGPSGHVARVLPFILAGLLLAGCSFPIKITETESGERVLELAIEEEGSETETPTATPATPTPFPSPTPDLRPTYVVQAGDSPWSIGKAHGVNWQDLLNANGIYDPASLSVGDVLVLPIEPTATLTPTPTVTPTVPTPPVPTPSATPTITPTPDPRIFHTIVSGDTLWGISTQFGISIQDLIDANVELNPNRLQIGLELYIPVTATPTPTPETRTPTPTPTATFTPTATPTPVPFTPPPEAHPDNYRQWPRYLADLINERRVAHGLPALMWSDALAKAAQAHAQDCARRDDCSHIGSDGSSLRTRLARVAYEPRWAGENWAFAFNPEQVLTWWYDEPPGKDPHRSNLLHKHYREIGIGIARAERGWFYFVADFGSTE